MKFIKLAFGALVKNTDFFNTLDEIYLVFNSKSKHPLYIQIQDMDVGDLTERLDLKKRLKCKPFSWYLEHIWPELCVYNQDVRAWGSVSYFYPLAYWEIMHDFVV